eukprot:gene9973-11809_t
MICNHDDTSRVKEQYEYRIGDILWTSVLTEGSDRKLTTKEVVAVEEVVVEEVEGIDKGLPDSLAVPVWAGDCIPGGELGLIAVHKTDTLYDVQKRLEDEILGTDCPFEMISLVTWTESQKPKGTVIEDIHRVPLYSAQQDRLAFCFFANPLVYILLKSVPSTAELMKTNLYGAPDAFMLVDDVDASCCCFTGGDSATKNEQNDDEELKMQAVHVYMACALQIHGNSYSPAQQMGLLFVDANHTWRDVCVMIRQELLAEANLSSALGSTVLSVGGFKPMQSEDEKKMKQQKGKAGEGAKKGLKGKEGPETKKGQENMEKDQETEDQDEGQEHTKKDQQDEGEGKGKGDKKKGKGDKKKGRGNEDEDRKNVSDESVLQEASHIDDGNEQHKNPTEASTSDSLKTSDVLQNPEIHQSANQQEVRRTPGKAAASAEQSEIRIHIDKEVQTERKEETKKAEQPHKNAPGGKVYRCAQHNGAYIDLCDLYTVYHGACELLDYGDTDHLSSLIFILGVPMCYLARIWIPKYYAGK